MPWDQTNLKYLINTIENGKLYFFIWAFDLEVLSKIPQFFCFNTTASVEAKRGKGVQNKDKIQTKDKC